MGEEAFTKAWGFGSSFPGPVVEAEAPTCEEPRGPHLLDMATSQTRLPLHRAAAVLESMGAGDKLAHLRAPFALHEMCLRL